MSDADLEQIRSARLEQLQQKQRQQQLSDNEGAQQDKQREQEAEARRTILNQILLPEAADRLGRIRLVKEPRATEVENRLIMMARTGQLQSKVTEEQLKELLNALAERNEEEKIVVTRRKADWDSDDDNLLDL